MGNDEDASLLPPSTTTSLLYTGQLGIDGFLPTSMASMAAMGAEIDGPSRGVDGEDGHISANILQAIQKRNSKQIKCIYCDRTFSKRSNMTRHVAINHSTVRPFRCQFCSKSYA